MKKKFSFVAIFFVAGIVLAVAISTSAFREAYRSRTIQNEVQDLQSQAQHIQSENQALTEQIAYLQTPEFQEKIAKEKLNLQQPDESVVVVNPSADQQQPIQQTSNENIQTQQDIPNYIKWWNLFFKYD